MAASLVRASHLVHAYDLSEQAMSAAVASGCVAARSAADAVRAGDAVITMLPTGGHVRAVYGDAILPNARPGTLLIDCSTIDVESARAVAAERNSSAPVS